MDEKYKNIYDIAKNRAFGDDIQRSVYFYDSVKALDMAVGDNDLNSEYERIIKTLEGLPKVTEKSPTRAKLNAQISLMADIDVDLNEALNNRLSDKVEALSKIVDRSSISLIKQITIGVLSSFMFIICVAFLKSLGVLDLAVEMLTDAISIIAPVPQPASD